MRAMEIKLGVPGVGRSARQLDSIADSLKAVADQQRRLNAAISAAPKMRQIGGGGAPRTAGGPGGGYLSGPNQKLAKIRQQMQDAQSKGLQDVVEDLKILEFRAQRSLTLGQRRLGQGQAAIGAPGLLDLFQQMNGFLAAGRGIGGIAGGAGGAAGGMRAIAALPALLAALPGPLKLLAPALIAAGAGAVAASMLASRAAASMGPYRAAGVASGGSPGDIARLAAAGIAPGQIPGAAAGLRNRLASDPLAQMAAGGIGISAQLPRGFGSTNDAKLYMDTLAGLRRITDSQEQLRKAILLGVESELDMIKVSDRTWRLMMRDTAIREVIQMRGAEQARELTAQQRRLEMAFGNLSDEVGTKFIPGMSALTDLAARIVNFGAMLAMINPTLGSIQNLGESLQGLLRLIDGGEGKLPDALRANTAAMMDLNTYLQRTYGGGPRARGSIPGGLGGEMLRRSIEAGTLGYVPTLGAFAS